MDEKLMIVDVLKRLVGLLVAGDFSAVEELTRGVRLSADDVAGAIEDYGGVLVVPPERVYECLDVIEVEGAEPRRWSVRFDLWTEDEGKSDLTLEATVVNGDPEPRLELDNLHVL